MWSEVNGKLGGPRLQLSAAECDVFSGMRATYSAGREWHFHQPPIGEFVKNQDQNPILVRKL